MLDDVLLETIKEFYPEETICTVWYCKTIQNKKGLYYLPNKKLYIEATLNGDANQIYLDEYTKVDKKVINVLEA